MELAPSVVEARRYSFRSNDGYTTIKEGWLAKQGNLILKWRQRYFRLREQVLHYYKSDATDAEPICSFYLRGCKVFPDLQRETVFVLQTRDKVNRTFQTRIFSERTIWIEKIQECIRLAESNELAPELSDSYARKNVPLDLARVDEMILLEEKRLAELTLKYESFYDPPATLENQMTVQQKRVLELKHKRSLLVEQDQLEKKIVSEVPECKRDILEDLDSSVNRRMSLDEFEFLKVLGKGTFGKVMLAQKKDSKVLYAIKILKKSTVIKSRQTTKHTNTENRVLKTLRHPFLVHLDFAFQTEERLYLVMEYINGGELFTHMQRTGVFSETKARFYAAEIVLAMTYLHNKGIVYRDLKLENLVVDSFGHIKIIDFGLCKDNISTDGRTDTFCGTPEYIAPEVLEDDDYGKSVDWWALGIIIYEMMTGQPPFIATNVEEVFEKILVEEITYPARFSKLTVSLLGQLLARDPSERIGYGIEDGEEVKRHKFFASVNWDNLISKRVLPPYIPNIANNTDTSNFDPQFTKESVQLTPVKAPEFGDDLFKGFTFAGNDEVLSQVELDSQ